MLSAALLSQRQRARYLVDTTSRGQSVLLQGRISRNRTSETIIELEYITLFGPDIKKPTAHRAINFLHCYYIPKFGQNSHFYS